MAEICADCGSQDFTSCFSESFPTRGLDGVAFVLTLRLCLRCGARFTDWRELRSYLHRKLPARPASERLRV
ncbi:MAG TPA: hypothetical protein VFK85_09410 [Anaeromyxobacteraceae bacterium]|nr:hypothetical protein [Anaeromyxobacteraceae bacterium]